MLLTPNQKTILAHLYQTKNELPVDATLHQHCTPLMPVEDRETEIRNLLNTGYLGSQTGFSGFFISPSGQDVLQRHRKAEREIRQRYIMKVAGITSGAIA
ncbi:MAG: hypothetical protein V4658_00590, partial [Bacteroidota bacterium]